MIKSITGKITQDYLERFPDCPTRTLAKKMYSENSEAFTDDEHARAVIRLYRGQSGSKNRLNTKNKEFFTEGGSYNPFALPESDMFKWSPVNLPATQNKILLMNDIHLPYHDIPAITTMINHALKGETNTIILNGDILDCYQMSRFVKDPRMRSMNDEIWQLVEFINVLQDTFKGAKIYFKLGNHEERIENYLKVKAPELIDMSEYRLENILKIRGIKDVDVIYKQLIYAGRLAITHGHELGGMTSSVNPARGLFLKAMACAIQGHLHKSSSHSDTDINEKLISTWSVACLCGLHPEYAFVNKWNHGFAKIETDGREFMIENFQIYDGKIFRQ